MVYKCAACGCSCRYDKQAVVKDVSSHQSTLKTHDLCLEGSALLQRLAVPLSAALVTSTQRTDAANERTNETFGECLASDGVQGCKLDVIQSRLNMETLPDGFLCHKMSDKILLYKLDIGDGLISVECGIILWNDFQVTCSSYNEVLPVNVYEDLLSQGNQITCVSQLLNLMDIISVHRIDHTNVKTEAESDVSDCEENYSAVTDVYDTKFEPEESSVCALGEGFIAQSSLSENYFSGACESESNPKCEAETYTHERAVEGNWMMASLKKEYESDGETSDADSSDTLLTDVERKSFQDKKSSSNKTHISAVDVEKKSHRCPHCDASFVQKIDLKQHRKSVHNQEKSYECSECDKKFSTRRNRDTHQRSVHCGEKPYLCDLCAFKCSDKSSLTRHQKTVHQGVKRFACTICEYKASEKGNLKKHYKSVHSEQSEPQSYSCTDCGSTFFRAADLKKHFDVLHKGLKPFSCTECSSRFSRNDKLLIHIKTVHRQEKPYSCSVCTKCFSGIALVRRHEAAVHDGYKPHQCSHCGKSFSRNAHLTRHAKTCHN